MACLFSEIQFCFWVDLKAIAYKHGPEKGSHGDITRNSKNTNMGMEKPQSRSLVPLIVIQNYSKVDFSDCGFRCIKVFNSKNS